MKCDVCGTTLHSDNAIRTEIEKGIRVKRFIKISMFVIIWVIVGYYGAMRLDHTARVEHNTNYYMPNKGVVILTILAPVTFCIVICDFITKPVSDWLDEPAFGKDINEQVD